MAVVRRTNYKNHRICQWWGLVCEDGTRPAGKVFRARLPLLVWSVATQS